MQNNSVMQQALGKQWDELAPIIRKMYDLPVKTTTKLDVEGTMSVDYPWAIYPMVMAGKIFGAMIEKRGTGIKGSVYRSSRIDSNALFWHRILIYPDGKQCSFKSRMEFDGEGQLIEYVRFGLGLRLTLTVKEGCLIYQSRGYTWRPFRRWLTIPDWMLYGKALITETPISENQIKLDFTMQHPLYGKTYQYKGIFQLFL